MKSSKRLLHLKREFDALDRARRHAAARKEFFLRRAHGMIEPGVSLEVSKHPQWRRVVFQFYHWKAKLRRIEKGLEVVFCQMLQERSVLRRARMERRLRPPTDIGGLNPLAAANLLADS